MLLQNIRVVLVETSHPGNIGAAARAMKTMGLSRLYLVKPRQFPSAEASARASAATDILAAATVCDGLREAIADCNLVLATSARRRSIAWPEVNPSEAAQLAAERSVNGQVAIVFGREKWGLSNSELDACHFLMYVPTNPEYRSLNLASAVQLVAYELRMALAAAPETEQPAQQPRDSAPATTAEMEALYTHLEQTLLDIGFLNPAAPRQAMRRLKRLFNRARLEQTEANILRGVLTKAQESARRKRPPQTESDTNS